MLETAAEDCRRPRVPSRRDDEEGEGLPRFAYTDRIARPPPGLYTNKKI